MATGYRLGLLVSDFYPHSTGGTEAYVSTLAAALRPLGAQPTLAVPHSVETSETHDGMDIYRFPVSPLESRTSRAETQGRVPPAGMPEFEAWLDRTKPDVLHVHSLSRGCGLYHIKAARDRGVPVFLTLHLPGILCMRGTLMRWGRVACDGQARPVRCAACYWQGRGMPRAVGLPMAAALYAVGAPSPPPPFDRLDAVAGIGRLIKHAHEVASLVEQIVVVAPWMRDVLIRNGIGADKLAVSPQGLMSAPPPPVRPENTRTRPVRIGYIGRLTPVKGVDVLIRAFNALPASVAAELVIYGAADGSYAHSLKTLAGPRVQFAGAVAPDDKWNAYKTMDVVALPSTCQDMAPLVVQEAFAAGLPVIGSDSGGIADAISQDVDGLLVKPGNVPAWVAAIERVAERFASGYEWRVAAPRTVDDVATQMDNLYRNAIATRLATLSVVE